MESKLGQNHGHRQASLVTKYEAFPFSIEFNHRYLAYMYSHAPKSELRQGCHQINQSHQIIQSHQIKVSDWI